MPVYEYQCKKCGRTFEYQMRMSDPDKSVCEACGAPELEKLISHTAFALKGGGWYKDLYASTKPEGARRPIMVSAVMRTISSSKAGGRGISDRRSARK